MVRGFSHVRILRVGVLSLEDAWISAGVCRGSMHGLIFHEVTHRRHCRFYGEPEQPEQSEDVVQVADGVVRIDRFVHDRVSCVDAS